MTSCLGRCENFTPSASSSTRLLARDPNMPSLTTYHKLFSSMVAAHNAAGGTTIKTVFS